MAHSINANIAINISYYFVISKCNIRPLKNIKNKQTLQTILKLALTVSKNLNIISSSLIKEPFRQVKKLIFDLSNKTNN